MEDVLAGRSWFDIVSGEARNWYTVITADRQAAQARAAAARRALTLPPAMTAGIGSIDSRTLILVAVGAALLISLNSHK